MDLELTLPTGGVTALFGSSGAGKSSFFNAIVGAGLNQDSEIIVDRVSWLHGKKKLPIEKRKVVLARQRPYLFPHLTIKKNLCYGFERLKPKRSSIFFDEIIAQFNIEPLLKHYPRHLSGGELQRAAIAQALLASPKLLLLDEVFSALDEYQKIIIMNNLKAHIERENISMMYITHSKSEVCQLADRVILINHGKIERIMSCFDFMNESNSVSQRILAIEKTELGCELKLANGLRICLSHKELQTLLDKEPVT
jgi:molybdate transport system ATP-binding protein